MEERILLILLRSLSRYLTMVAKLSYYMSDLFQNDDLIVSYEVSRSEGVKCTYNLILWSSILSFRILVLPL